MSIRRRWLVSVLLLAPLGARAASVQAYDPSAFKAAQEAGKPILLFIEAPWCPTCAKERPILAKLYEQPEFAGLQVFTIDFDTSKPLLRQLNVQMQSTLIAFHGKAEKARATGATDPEAVRAIVAAANA